MTTYNTPHTTTNKKIFAARYTEKIEPSTITKSAALAARSARSKSSLRRFWPKLIVAGFKKPPHSHKNNCFVFRKYSKCDTRSDFQPQVWHSTRLFIPCNS